MCNSYFMWKIFTVLFIVSCFGCKRTDDGPSQPETMRNVLLLTKTAGFRHESIADGVKLFEQHAAEWNIAVTSTESTSNFTTAGLKNIDLIVLLNTTGDIFAEAEQDALQAYIRNGGSLLGIHAATDAEYDWPWYGSMIGGWFSDHPHTQQATCNIAQPNHASMAGLPLQWVRTDEWYNFKGLQPDNNVLITIDESSYVGGKHGTNHPLCWTREFDGGRIFYTAMGHTPASYTEPLYIEHIKGAVNWLLN